MLLLLQFLRILEQAHHHLQAYHLHLQILFFFVMQYLFSYVNSLIIAFLCREGAQLRNKKARFPFSGNLAFNLFSFLKPLIFDYRQELIHVHRDVFFKWLMDRYSKPTHAIMMIVRMSIDILYTFGPIPAASDSLKA